MKRLSTLPAICFLATACGSSSGDPASAAMFVGTWTASADTTQVATCGTQSATTPLWGTVPVVLKSANSGEIITEPTNGCYLTWVCNGDLATLEGNQSCQVNDPLTSTVWNAKFTTGTLTLGGNQVALHDQGTATLTGNGATQNCTFNQSGSFTKN